MLGTDIALSCGKSLRGFLASFEFLGFRGISFSLDAS
jgi:hypothetical protein